MSGAFPFVFVPHAFFVFVRPPPPALDLRLLPRGLPDMVNVEGGVLVKESKIERIKFDGGG
jgi:hypothetical protein